MNRTGSDATGRARAAAVVVAALLAVLTLLAGLLPAHPVFSGELSYVEVHLVLELAAVVVSLLVFSVGWNAFTEGGGQGMLLLACGFLAVGMIDTLHALSFRGMPRLVTESSPQKAIFFWLAARTVMAATLIAVALGVSMRIARAGALALALAIAALVAWIGLFREDALPPTFVPGLGLTPFKIGCELALMAAFAAAAGLFARRAQSRQSAADWWLACASVVSGLAEVFFCRYVEVSDLYNALGHLYKIVAFAIIYRVVFVTGIRAPYGEIRALERKFRASFDHAFQFMALTAVDGRVLEMNEAALRAARSTRDRWFDRPLWTAPWWSPSAGQTERIEQAVRGAAQGRTVKLDVEYLGRNGATRYADFSVKPFFGESGAVQMLIAEGHDVTERRQREEEVRLSDYRLQQAVRVSGMGFFDHDHRDDRIYCSPECRRIYGWAPEEEVSLPGILERTHEADRARTGDAIARAHDPAGDGRYDFEHRIVLPDGQVRWLTVRSQSIFEGEGAARRVMRTIGAVLDVTSRKNDEEALRMLNATLEQRVTERTAELEQALQTLARAQDELVRSGKLAALGSLVAGVAHELNTPLGNALMVASTLRDRSAEFEREASGGTLRRSRLDGYVKMSVQAAELVMHNLSQAADLVASFKQVAVDQASAKRRRFDLKETIEELLSTVHHQLRLRPVRIRTELAEGLTLDSYPGPLGQVLNNLLNNALEHAFADQADGQILIRTAPSGEDAVTVEFSDDGAGIEAANLPRIFDPFFTTRFGRGGSGLGLNIVHNIVTGVLGGRVAVDSAPQRGTRFTLTIPRVAPRSADGAAAEAPSRSAA